MKGSKITCLVIAALVLGVVAWFIDRRDRDSWRQEALPAGSRVLGDFDINAVASVRITSPDGIVTLTRGEDGWGVAEREGYPSDFERIATLVRQLHDLRAVQGVPVGDGEHGALALRLPEEEAGADETGMFVELHDAGGNTLSAAVLGKIHYTTPPGMRPEIGGAATGRYVLDPRRGGNACLVNETFTDLQTTPPGWIDKVFVRPGMARKIEVKADGKDRSWTIDRPAMGSAWQLAGAKKNEQLDPARLISLDSMLTGMAVADVPDGPDDERVKPLEDDPLTITAETFDGVRYVFTIGQGGEENLPVTVTAQAMPEEEAGDEEDAEALRLAGERAKARDEKLAGAQRFEDRVVFIPRNFLQPFLQARSELTVPAQPTAGN